MVVTTHFYLHNTLRREGSGALIFQLRRETHLSHHFSVSLIFLPFMIFPYQGWKCLWHSCHHHYTLFYDVCAARMAFQIDGYYKLLS